MALRQKAFDGAIHGPHCSKGRKQAAARGDCEPSETKSVHSHSFISWRRDVEFLDCPFGPLGWNLGRFRAQKKMGVFLEIKALANLIPNWPKSGRFASPSGRHFQHMPQVPCVFGRLVKLTGRPEGERRRMIEWARAGARLGARADCIWVR